MKSIAASHRKWPDGRKIIKGFFRAGPDFAGDETLAKEGKLSRLKKDLILKKERRPRR